MGSCGWDDCAATIMTMVVSTPCLQGTVIDGGSKTFTSDPLRFSGRGGFRRVVEAPQARFFKRAEEHYVVDMEAHAGPPLRIGDRLRILPNHVCVAVHMHETAHGGRGETFDQPERVEGRGQLQGTASPSEPLEGKERTV